MFKKTNMTLFESAPFNETQVTPLNMTNMAYSSVCESNKPTTKGSPRSKRKRTDRPEMDLSMYEKRMMQMANFNDYTEMNGTRTSYNSLRKGARSGMAMVEDTNSELLQASIVEYERNS